MTIPPRLIIGIGNPSRGDDALAPALIDRLEAEGLTLGGGVELLTDFQLQVEHALDLAGRRAVLFVDAAWPGAAAGVQLSRIGADTAAPLTSHALRPQAVLQVCVSLQQAVPPAWLLAIEGECFELGAPLSEPAKSRLDEAVRLARDWLAMPFEK